MNQLIEKFARESGAWDQVYGHRTFMIDEHFDIEKFARLIVRECVNICLDRHDTWRWDEDADSDSGPRDCARSIKQHFGVEE